MTAPHFVRPDHHNLPTGHRTDGAGHDTTSLNRRPRPSTAPPGLFAPAPEVIVEKAVKAKPKKKVKTVAEGRPSRAKSDRTVPREAICGTVGGYHRHFRITKTAPCDPCREARNAYARSRSKATPAAPKPAPPCGTTAAYRRHRTNGEPTCEPCREANAAAQRAAWQRRIANGWVRKRDTKRSAA